MTFKEFFETHPKDIKKAKACKNMDEFKKLVDSFEISYAGDNELKEAYNFIKNDKKELSEDDLNSVAGGKKDTYAGEGNTFNFK